MNSTNPINPFPHSPLSRCPDNLLLAEKELKESMGGGEVQEYKIVKGIQHLCQVAAFFCIGTKKCGQITQVLEQKEKFVYLSFWVKSQV
jgi:hypothetical protein